MVSNRDEILDNVEVFLEGLEGENVADHAKAIQLIKTSNVFLAILSEEVNFFIPSQFLAVKDQNFDTIDLNQDENENLAIINQILGSTPKIDKTKDELFLDFCDEVEINRNDVGLSREYWIIKDL
ncbi:hypothetical protein [Faecalibacter sp. LW9]|uniref:hypothetical protein n=1 Tax=Faecalibacter sp. LW9 TaxID=3103144 RepID=UPI002AFFD566|nr:hypothetical protein [Faecalibacter sp. LW9]